MIPMKTMLAVPLPKSRKNEARSAKPKIIKKLPKRRKNARLLIVTSLMQRKLLQKRRKKNLLQKLRPKRPTKKKLQLLPKMMILQV